MRTYINSLDMGNTPFLEEQKSKKRKAGAKRGTGRKGSYYP